MRFGHVIVLTFLHYTNGERRLIAGEDVTTNKRYMAYLVKAKASIRYYDSWICGGAIIHPWLILTSAACVEDVQNMYAIAGTERYINGDEIETDPCPGQWRRKVFYTCVPIAYDLRYDNVSKWSYDDISIVKLEISLYFKGTSWDWASCSYFPSTIAVNLDPKYEEPGTDAIVLGWGHSRKWRLPNMTEDLNQKKLQYVPVRILDPEECKKYFTGPNMAKIIDDYMICTFYGGQLDETGKVIGARKYYSDGAIRGGNGGKARGYHRPRIIINGTEITNEKEFQNFMDSRQKTVKNGMKGICQNDHGGPLVTWINGVEHVIGVASVFRVDKHSNCVGPFLYTSTAKNKQFIECIFDSMLHRIHKKERRSAACEPTANGRQLSILRRYVKWTVDHTDSVAPNLNVHRRPQIPMSHYRNRDARK